MCECARARIYLFRFYKMNLKYLPSAVRVIFVRCANIHECKRFNATPFPCDLDAKLKIQIEMGDFTESGNNGTFISFLTISSTSISSPSFLSTSTHRVRCFLIPCKIIAVAIFKCTQPEAMPKKRPLSSSTTPTEYYWYACNNTSGVHSAWKP